MHYFVSLRLRKLVCIQKNFMNNYDLNQAVSVRMLELESHRILDDNPMYGMVS